MPRGRCGGNGRPAGSGDFPHAVARRQHRLPASCGGPSATSNKRPAKAHAGAQLRLLDQAEQLLRERLFIPSEARNHGLQKKRFVQLRDVERMART